VASYFFVVATAHIQFVCVSVYDDYKDDTCNKALLWIGTYDHGAVQGGTIPGKVTVSVGGNNYVTPDRSAQSPFLFQNYCLHNLASSSTMSDMRTQMSSSTFLQSCPSAAQGRLRPQLGQAVGQDADGFKLRCASAWNPASGSNDVVFADTDSFVPNCGQGSGYRQWAFVELDGLDTTTGGQDITFAMSGVDQNFNADGSGPCLAPINAAEVQSTDLFNTAFYQNNLMNIKPSQIYIPGCGLPCGPHPSIVGATHACTASSVPSGTNCNVECGGGKTAAGSYVICNGGNYTGNIECTSEPTASASCTKGKCAGIVVPGGGTIVSTPGCGDRVKAGTCCDISCSSAEKKFSQGFICAEGTTFVAQNGTKCVTCKGTSCGALAEDFHSAEISAEPDTSLEDVITPDGVVCVSGTNFNPVRDKVILIAREKGTNPNCKTATSAVGGLFLSCNSTSESCGETSSDVLYVCEGATTTPDYGKVCICDADAQGGCPDLVAKFVVDGPITRSFTLSPTTSPTSSPSFTPTPAPISEQSSFLHRADGTFTGWLPKLQYPIDEYALADLQGMDNAWQDYEWKDIRAVPEVRLSNGGENPESTNVYFDFTHTALGAQFHMLVDQVTSVIQQCDACQLTVAAWSDGGSSTLDFTINGNNSGSVVHNGNQPSTDFGSFSNAKVTTAFGASTTVEISHNILEISFDAGEGSFGISVLGSTPPHWFLGIATARGIIVEAVTQADFMQAQSELPPKGFCVAGSEGPGCIPLPPVDPAATVNPDFADSFGVVVDNLPTTFEHSPDGSFTNFTNTSLEDGGLYEWKGVRSAPGRFTDVYFDYVSPESATTARRHRREASNGTEVSRGRLYIANDWKYNDEKPVQTNCYNLFKVYTGNNENWLIKVFGDATVEVILNGRYLNFSDPEDLLAQELYADGAVGFNISPLDPVNKHSIFELAIYASPGRFAVEFHDPGPRFLCDVLETEAARFAGVLKTSGGSTITTCDKTTFDKIAASIAGNVGADTGNADAAWVDDYFWSKRMNDFCQVGENEAEGCEQLPAVEDTARTNTNYKLSLGTLVDNPLTTFDHVVDGAFTGYNATLGSTSYEWQGVVPAIGRFTDAYFDFRPTVAGRGYIYLLNDWKYNDDLPVQPHCYNLFKVHTGNNENWSIKVFGDKHVEIILNGVLLDFENENDTLTSTMMSAGAVGWNFSPNVPDAEHSIFELMFTASAGRFAVEFHDPGPRFACDVLETEPIRFTGIFKEEGGSVMAAVDLQTYQDVVSRIERGIISDYCQPDEVQFACLDLFDVSDTSYINANYADYYNISIAISATSTDFDESQFVMGNSTTFTLDNFKPSNDPLVGKFGYVYLGYDTPTTVQSDIDGLMGGMFYFLNDWVVNTNFDSQPDGFTFLELFVGNGDVWTIKAFHDANVPAEITLQGVALAPSDPVYRSVNMVTGSGVSRQSTVVHALYKVDVRVAAGRFALRVSAPGPRDGGAAGTTGGTLVRQDPAHISGVLLEAGGLTASTVDNATFDHIVDQIKIHNALDRGGAFFGLALPGGSEYVGAMAATLNDTNACDTTAALSTSDNFFDSRENSLTVVIVFAVIIFVLLIVLVLLCCCPWCCCFVCCIPVGAAAATRGYKQKSQSTQTGEMEGAPNSDDGLFTETNMDFLNDHDDDEDVAGFGDTDMPEVHDEEGGVGGGYLAVSAQVE